MNAPLALESQGAASSRLTPDPKYPHKDELRTKLVYAADGQIYVNSIHMRDHDVVAEVASIRRAAGGRPLTTVPSTLSEIQEIYAASQSTSQKVIAIRTSAASDSDRQSAVVGIFREARGVGASDVHMTMIRGDKTFIRFRKFGELYTHAEVTADEGLLMIKALGQSMVTEANSGQYDDKARFQGRLRDRFAEDAGVWSGRLAITPTGSGLHAVMRLLYPLREQSLRLAELGFLPQQVKIFEEFLYRGRGMVLNTGPTGAGKTTTLKALIDLYIERTQGRRAVYTIEHPIEFPIRGAIQTPIMEHRGLNDAALAQEYAEATTHSLRMDPDLLMSGEIRSRSVAASAFTAAMTGHGMLTTLHVDDWVTTFERLLDLGVSRSLVFNPRLLRVISNQSLARTLCPHCKVPFLGNENSVPPPIRARIQSHCDIGGVYLRGPSCPKCVRGIGGQTIVAEVVRTDRRLMEAYKNEGPFAAYDYWIKSTGGLTKCKNLITRINEGLIDPTTGEEDVCLLDDDEMMAW